jgi:AraC-like DNA-binding protein
MSKLDNFISVKPPREFQHQIDSVYFHSCDHTDSKLSFTYYPHIKHAVTIYLGSTAQTTANKTIIKPQNNSFPALYSTVRDHLHQVEIHGSFKKIRIIFKPYGLNHFINRPIQDFHHSIISVFREWDSDFQQLAVEIWKTEDVDSRLALLEVFLRSQKSENINHKFSGIIDELTKSENTESVEHVSNRHGLNRKALYRLFIKELDCSPSKFMKILRFRRSLEAYLQSADIKLTEAAVAQFYDQSDFIKNVKQITSMTPRRLTQDISVLKNTIFWKIG